MRKRDIQFSFQNWSGKTTMNVQDVGQKIKNFYPHRLVENRDGCLKK